VRGVRSEPKLRGTPLAAMAGRAAEFLRRVWAVCLDEQVETGMGGIFIDLRLVQAHGAQDGRQVARIEGEFLTLLLSLQEKIAGFYQLILERFVDVIGSQLRQRSLVERGALQSQMAGRTAIEAGDVL